MKPQRKIAVLAIGLLIVLGSLFRSGAFTNVRNVDLVQLLASGVCIGAIITGMVHMRKHAKA